MCDFDFDFDFLWCSYLLYVYYCHIYAGYISVISKLDRVRKSDRICSASNQLSFSNVKFHSYMSWCKLQLTLSRILSFLFIVTSKQYLLVKNMISHRLILIENVDASSMWPLYFLTGRQLLVAMR